MYKNVINRENYEKENKEWKNLLTVLGEVKKTFNSAF